MREDNSDILCTSNFAACDEGGKHRADLISYLTPYLAPGDEAVREKAWAVERMFKGELDIREWATEAARSVPWARYGPQLPKFRESPQVGELERAAPHLSEFVWDERIDLILDASFLSPRPGLRRRPGQRGQAGRLRGHPAALVRATPGDPEAVDLPRLLKDRSDAIRRCCRSGTRWTARKRWPSPLSAAHRDHHHGASEAIRRPPYGCSRRACVRAGP